MVSGSFDRSVRAKGFRPRAAGPLVAAFALTLGCQGGQNAVLAQLTQARQLAGDLRVEFHKAADASDRAVMADTDEASIAFASEANRMKALVKSTSAALEPILAHLAFPDELKSLRDFGAHFSEYEQLDRGILELAVENTNLKAQRLSFGPARGAADAFRDAAEALAPTAKDRCQADALVAKAVLAVREIQVLQAPHIAESSDDIMTTLEKEMTAREASAKQALAALGGLLDAKARPRVAEASAAFERFQALGREILKLSRRNSNVRSLELSVRQKPAVTAACDESLRVLQDALGREGFTATR